MNINTGGAAAYHLGSDERGKAASSVPKVLSSNNATKMAVDGRRHLTTFFPEEMYYNSERHGGMKKFNTNVMILDDSDDIEK